MNIMQAPPPEDEDGLRRAIARVRLINWLHALFYFLCAFAGAIAANEVFHWKEANPFLLGGTLTTIISLGFLVYWLWLDRSEDVLECPRWLRMIIVLTAWLSLLLLAYGTLLQYTKA